MSRITVTGNITSDPELKFINTGAAVVNFNVAESYKGRGDNAKEETYFWPVVVWNHLAENVANSIHKGQRVVVEGRLVQRSWETSEGERRTKTEILADSVGVELRFGTAQYTRSETTKPDATSDRRPFDEDEPF